MTEDRHYSATSKRAVLNSVNFESHYGREIFCHWGASLRVSHPNG
jgi:hypothetical protein